MMKRLLAVLAVLGLLLAACAKNNSSTDAAGQLSSGVASDDGSDGSDASADDSSDAGDQSDDVAGSVSDDGDDPSDSPASGKTLRSSVLAKALSDAGVMNSGRFEGVITIVGSADSDLPGEFQMLFSGSFDNDANASRITLDMSDIFAAAAASDPSAAGMEEMFSSMFDEPMEMIQIGDKSWVKWGLLAMFGVEDKWLETEADASDAATMGFGGTDSPTAMLEELADADADIQDLGQEDIRGVTTTHYRAELALETLAEGMTPEERADFEQSFGGASADGTYLIDLFVDGDDQLQRFVLDISDLPADSADGMQSMVFEYDIMDHGQDQGIAPPPADEIITEAELGLSLEDFGGLSG